MIKLPPGSPAAKAEGCICMQKENRFGLGILDFPGAKPGERHYWIKAGCPIHHGMQEEKKVESRTN